MKVDSRFYYAGTPARSGADQHWESARTFLAGEYSCLIPALLLLMSGAGDHRRRSVPVFRQEHADGSCCICQAEPLIAIGLAG